MSETDSHPTMILSHHLCARNVFDRTHHVSSDAGFLHPIRNFLDSVQSYMSINLRMIYSKLDSVRVFRFSFPPFQTSPRCNLQFTYFLMSEVKIHLKPRPVSAIYKNANYLPFQWNPDFRYGLFSPGYGTLPSDATEEYTIHSL
ncbi:hypothetical protein ARMGADRAFT_134080 [Armillaria gallica]|uniref:Uncharacterized protein n=1 Tax=Armillaria gallica TaxID=47427 RepID=A0A2H3CW27_ARMGA|nr:hypothetical protein ARMGADRAFT_134080 [Armillaria gallica]